MSVVVHCGEKKDGNASGAFSALDPLGSLEAVHSGHLGVEQDNGVVIDEELFEGVLAAGYSRARPWDWLSSSSVRRLAWIVLMATPIVATSRSRNVRCRGENE